MWNPKSLEKLIITYRWSETTSQLNSFYSEPSQLLIRYNSLGIGIVLTINNCLASHISLYLPNTTIFKFILIRGLPNSHKFVISLLIRDRRNEISLVLLRNGCWTRTRIDCPWWLVKFTFRLITLLIKLI